MNIIDAKRYVKDTVEAYLMKDGNGLYRIAPSEQRPIFLVGPPGIGKTAIMSQVADELGVGLVAYSMTHHTRQSALGLPFIVHRSYRGGSEFDISEYTMSEIIASMYDFMEETGLDNGILFLDEINCVSETLYPSMLQFLQFKTFGGHAIPEGWIVVCAGNPPEYNKSVHEFDIVTLDRLRKVELQPDREAWLSYARDRSVHPAILSYLSIRPDDFYLVEATPEGKSFVSVRSWTELSELISLLEEMDKTVDKGLISQYVQHPEICDRFSAYYALFDKYRSDYQVESILQGVSDDSIAKRAQTAAFDERLALISLLIDSLTAEMKATNVRKGELSYVRDAIREAKESLVAGQPVREAFETPLAHLKEAATAAAGVSKTKLDQVPFLQAIDTLQNMIAQVELQAGDGNDNAFEVCSAEYEKLVNEFEAHADCVSTQLDNAFNFISNVFGDAREMLIFTTELTARGDCAQFIAVFGNESYHEQSNRLAIETKRDQIFEELDELEHQLLGK